VIDLRNSCSYKDAVVSLGTERAVNSISQCHFECIAGDLTEKEAKDGDQLRSMLAGYWQTVIQNATANPNEWIAYHAHSGDTTLGFAVGRKNHKSEYAGLDAEFQLLMVRKNARGFELGRRLLSSLAGSFYTSRFRNAFFIGLTGDQQAAAFCHRLGGKVFASRDNQASCYGCLPAHLGD
jgi:GNAT superfamily N-acetyltransferase